MVLAPELVRYEVTRLTLPIPGVRKFQARYEAAVPDYPHAAVSDLVSRRVPWSEMIDFIDAAGPHGFLIYFRNDVHPVMSLAGDNADCVSRSAASQRSGRSGTQRRSAVASARSPHRNSR